LGIKKLIKNGNIEGNLLEEEGMRNEKLLENKVKVNSLQSNICSSDINKIHYSSFLDSPIPFGKRFLEDKTKKDFYN